MEKFFYLGCQVDEVELMDLVLRRYHTLEPLKMLDAEKFCRLMIKAIEGEIKERHRQEWLAFIPVMGITGKFINFDKYYEMATGKNIDMRPADVIMAEIDAAHAKVEDK